MDAANPYAPPQAPLSDAPARAVYPEPDLPAWLFTLGAVIDTIALLLVIAGRDEGDSLSLVGLLIVVALALVIAAVFARVFRVVLIDRHYAHLALRQQAAAAFARLPPPR